MKVWNEREKELKWYSIRMSMSREGGVYHHFFPNIIGILVDDADDEVDNELGWCFLCVDGYNFVQNLNRSSQDDEDHQKMDKYNKKGLVYMNFKLCERIIPQ